MLCHTFVSQGISEKLGSLQLKKRVGVNYPREHDQQKPHYQWLGPRMQYLQCISNGDTAVLHYVIDIMETYGEPKGPQLWSSII